MIRFLLILCFLVAVVGAKAQDCIEGADTASPLRLKKENGLVLENLRIVNSKGLCIELLNCSNITIRNCLLGPSLDEGIKLYKCRNIRIENCFFSDNSAGVHAQESNGIKVLNCQFANMHFKQDRRQFIQFNAVTGSGNEISSNRGESISGQSDPEDLINLFRSSGTAESHIIISGNRFRGGGPSSSGGGILVGDKGGRFIDVENNVLVNPGQYGIAVASGENINIKNNIVWSEQKPWNNVGIYVWNQYKEPCGNVSVTGNKVNYTNAKGVDNPFYNGNNCGTVVESGNDWKAEIGPEVLPQQLLCVDWDFLFTN